MIYTNVKSYIVHLKPNQYNVTWQLYPLGQGTHCEAWWALSSLIKDCTQAPAVRALSPNYCIARGFPFFLLFKIILIS